MIFRFARHTDNIENLKVFYTDILGFKVLGHFENHDNYNGIFIGPENAGWHLEFTESDKPAHHTFDADDILVFYPETTREYEEITGRIAQHNIEKVKAQNPYWQNNGITISDPDGYQVIISPLNIKEEKVQP